MNYLVSSLCAVKHLLEMRERMLLLRRYLLKNQDIHAVLFQSYRVGLHVSQYPIEIAFVYP